MRAPREISPTVWAVDPVTGIVGVGVLVAVVTVPVGVGVLVAPGLVVGVGVVDLVGVGVVVLVGVGVGLVPPVVRVYEPLTLAEQTMMSWTEVFSMILESVVSGGVD